MAYNDKRVVEIVARGLAGADADRRREVATEIGRSPEQVRKYQRQQTPHIPPELWPALERALDLGRGTLSEAAGMASSYEDLGDITQRLARLARDAERLAEEADALHALVAERLDEAE